MTSREKFEAWMTDEQWFHGSDFEWDERRNCYAQFGIHLAYKAFLAAEGAAEQKLTDMAVQLANSESKCRELAAENVTARNTVQTFCDVVGANTDAICEEVGRDGVKAILNAMSATGNMPATDAFLAEVRAQGVERYAEQLKSEADRAEETGWEGAAKFLRSESEKVLAFAAQLRKGAAL